MGWLKDGGLNSYLYAPKDDLKHRAFWRELYSPTEAETLRELIQNCHSHGIRFIYALGPGLDIRYAAVSDQVYLHGRFEQLLSLGCRHFALLFDDIPDRMNADDLARFGSFAAAQCDLTNGLRRWLRPRAPGGRFLFCPTPYCGRMAGRQLGGANYLSTIGQFLDPDIDIFWTGPEIISADVTVAHLRELRDILRRKPVLWDNLHANDYDGRRMNLGPYAGRPAGLRAELGGILTNPNTEFPLNYVPIHTFAAFLRSGDDWDARSAYLEVLRSWAPRFDVQGRPVPWDELILFVDAYYLPQREGTLAEAFFQSLRELLRSPSAEWGDRVDPVRDAALRLREFCARLAELEDRRLFYALSRRAWELREELDLLLSFLRIKSGDPNASAHSDFHLPLTYRGGFVPRLQGLLQSHADGTFTSTQVSGKSI